MSGLAKSLDYQPRLSVEISEEQFLALQTLIPHGLKGQLFRVIIQDLIDLIRAADRRELVFAAVINRMVNIPSRATGVSDA